jgi:hypothetical protein
VSTAGGAEDSSRVEKGSTGCEYGSGGRTSNAKSSWAANVRQQQQDFEFKVLSLRVEASKSGGATAPWRWFRDETNAAVLEIGGIGAVNVVQPSSCSAGLSRVQ